MKRLNKVFKFVLRGLVLLIIVPLVCNALFMFVHWFLGCVSVNVCAGSVQELANGYLGSFGNRYHAFEVIDYHRQSDCPDKGHEKVLLKLYEKFPYMREKYLEAIVEGIVESDTYTENRTQLMRDIEKISGNNFVVKPAGSGSEEGETYELQSINNVADWWGRHLEERTVKAVDEMHKNPYYMGISNVCDNDNYSSGSYSNIGVNSRYFILDVIYYHKEVEEKYYCFENNHEKMLAAALEKYPDMREQYVSSIVEGIFDSSTKQFNRSLLVQDLEQAAGINFTEEEGRSDALQRGPVTMETIDKVSAWWSQQQEERIRKAVDAMTEDPHHIEAIY